MQYINFRTKNCIVSLKDIEELIKKKYEENQKMIKAITVKIFDLQWMLNSEMKFLNLTKILNEAGNDQIFIT